LSSEVTAQQPSRRSKRCEPRPETVDALVDRSGVVEHWTHCKRPHGRKRNAERIWPIKPCAFRSRRRSGWCEFSARLLTRNPCSCRPEKPMVRSVAP